MGASGSKRGKPSRKQCVVKCKNCESTTRQAKYECNICSKVICEICKDKIREICKSGRDHLLVDMKDMGRNLIQLKKQFQTDVDEIQSVCPVTDKILWISSFGNRVLRCYKQSGEKLEILFQNNMEVLGIAETSFYDILLCVPGESHLKELSFQNRGAIIDDTVYDVSPLQPTTIHVTNRDKVIIGAHTKGRATVTYLNDQGKHTHRYNLTATNTNSVTTIVAVTSTENGNIHVVQFTRYNTELEDEARVVVLSRKAKLKGNYTGHKDINKYRPFHPKDIATTPKDNVIVLDLNTQYIHALNNTGIFLAAYDLEQVGVQSPLALAFDPTGLLWIVGKQEDGRNHNAKLILVNLI